MIKIKVEDCGITSSIPSKVSYMGDNQEQSQKEIYYFGKPPKKPESLTNYLKKDKKK